MEHTNVMKFKYEVKFKKLCFIIGNLQRKMNYFLLDTNVFWNQNGLKKTRKKTLLENFGSVSVSNF